MRKRDGRWDRAVLGGLAIAGLVAAVTLHLAGAAPAYATVPALAAVGTLLGGIVAWPRSHEWIGAATTGTGVLLLVAAFATPASAGLAGGYWLLAASTLLTVLLTATFRWAPPRQVVTGAVCAGSAISLWTLCLVPEASFFEYLGITAFWSLPVFAASIAGGYPRAMQSGRRRAVLAARRAQQLELAHDLHDFVAHDVSGIVVQAQAARFVAEHDPEAAVAALERIERAGLGALASIDRTVRILRAPDGDEPESAGAREAPPGIDQLPDTVRRFGDTGRTRARLDIAPGVTGALSREAASTAYRVVVEALTNIRRHAPDAALATVAVGPAEEADGPAVAIRVTNDAPRRPDASPLGRRDRGQGLIHLTERVEALGGSLDAGPYEDGWRLTVTLPATSLPTNPLPVTSLPTNPLSTDPLPTSPLPATSLPANPLAAPASPLPGLTP
ncbi:histidine kinase [Streptomyces sp. NPDC007100]|uniref:sensor histidine kinase n=1 Tax=Streptomyces sp. NPDC007100 TaxID=3155602 RepID=UPI0033C3A1E8